MRPGKQPWSSTIARLFRGSAAKSRSWLTTAKASGSPLMVQPHVVPCTPGDPPELWMKSTHTHTSFFSVKSNSYQ